MLTLYGLKTCDTCRKAARALEASGKDVTFRDLRSDPLAEDQIARLLDNFGEQVVNTRSTTWRSLSDQERKIPAKRLLAQYPALMKRPVIDDGDEVTLGWDPKVQARYLG